MLIFEGFMAYFVNDFQYKYFKFSYIIIFLVKFPPSVILVELFRVLKILNFSVVCIEVSQIFLYITGYINKSNSIK